MTRGRHAKPRPARSDAPTLILVTLLAVGVGVAAALFDEPTQLRWSIVALAALVVIALIIVQRSGRKQAAISLALVETQRQELRTLRLELTRLHDMHDGMSAEIRGLRDEIGTFVTPVPSPPDPVYPSLHLPLVRAAFAEEMPAVRVAPPAPRAQGESSRVNVDADAGSDPTSSRQLLDLTASEIAKLRRAN